MVSLYDRNLLGDCSMTNEFWLCLHHLAEAYRREGLTPADRSDKIVELYARMPPVARREVLADLALVAHNMSDVYVAVVSQSRTIAEQDKSISGRKGA